MTPSELLQFAYRYGHQWNPDFPNLANIDRTALAKMNGTERDAKDLMHSWQSFDYNVVLLSAYYGHGQPEDEGKIGPATDHVAAMNRCAMPDFAPPPGASFDFGDPDLNGAVASMQEFAAAEAGLVGSYWRGCHPDRKTVHSLKIGIDITRAPKNWLANQDKILEARRACAAEIGVYVEFVINPQSLDGLQQYQVFQSIPGSVIGYNYFPNANSCGRISNGRLDTGYDPSDWTLHANLGTHESEGHGFGFDHTRGGIMNPSIVKVWPLSYKNDPSWNTAVRYYGGIPLTPSPGPDPDPTPDGLKLTLNVSQSGLIDAIAKQDFTAKAGDRLGRFTIIPAIG